MRFPAAIAAAVLISGLFCPSNTFAQPEPDAKAILQRVVTTLKSAKTFHFESELESDLASLSRGSTTRSRMTQIKGSEPNQIRFEANDGPNSAVVVSDGKVLWRATPDVREYIRSESPPLLFEAKGGGPLAETALRRAKLANSNLERADQDVIRAVQIGTETIELNGRHIDCVVVRADYSPPRGFAKTIFYTRTFWIDPTRNIVLQEASVTRGYLFPDRPYEVVESHHRRKVLVASIDEPVAASHFTYTPPAGFREVDKLVFRRTADGSEYIGKIAPVVALKTLTGDPIDLVNLRGKIILLDYWATWCGPCRDQMPAIAKLHQQVRDQGVVVLGVNRDESAETALKYLRENKYDWQSLYDGRGAGPSKPDTIPTFKVDAIPTLILIDREGIVRDYQVGSGDTTEKAIRESLRKLQVKLP
jgi:thiol-disulfide isomerase/thioredoxin/outer membrane lipoprotein-sorting protein